MLRGAKSSLQLNSYKLDSTDYQDRLRHLTHDNQQLQQQLQHDTATLHHDNMQLKQDYKLLQQDNKQLLQDNKQLRLRIANPPPVQAPPIDSKELKQEREKSSQYREMYENELQNKKDATEYYEKKLHALLRDKDMLVTKYEQRIKSLTQSTLPNEDSATSLAKGLNTKPLGKLPSSRKLPPSPHRPKVQTRETKETRGPQRPSPQCLDSLLNPCLERLERMNLSLGELRFIQQIDRFAGWGAVGKSQYVKLMREFPFECEDDELIEQSFQVVVTALREEGLEPTGNRIIDFLFVRMGQLE